MVSSTQTSWPLGEEEEGGAGGVRRDRMSRRRERIGEEDERRG